MFKKFKQLPDKLFKQLFTDFYSADNICEAKNILLSYMEQLGLPKWTKPPHRKKESVDKTGQKLKAETDDIVSMLLYIDENNLYDRLPTFVAVNRDNLPSANLSEGDLQCVLNKLAAMSVTLTSFNNLLLNSADVFTSAECKVSLLN